MAALVDSVHVSASHGFSKTTVAVAMLVEGVGAEGDAHAGVTVQHRSRVRSDPSEPNLRQVHLLHRELLEDLSCVGHDVAPGQLGENVTTRGLDLLALPVGARLHIGSAEIVVTGLRNPCQQINEFQPGLLKHVVRRGSSGDVQRLVGVMGVVARSGEVRAGQAIEVTLPPEPHLPLTTV